MCSPTASFCFPKTTEPIQHCHHGVTTFWNIIGAGTFCLPLPPPSISRGLAENLSVSSKYSLSFSFHLASPLINCSLIHPADVPVTSLALCPFPTPPYALYLLITVNARVLLCSLPSNKVVNTIGVTGKTQFYPDPFSKLLCKEGSFSSPGDTVWCHPMPQSWIRSSVTRKAITQQKSQYSATCHGAVRGCQGNRQLWPGVTTEQHMEKSVSALYVEVAASGLDACSCEMLVPGLVNEWCVWGKSSGYGLLKS